MAAYICYLILVGLQVPLFVKSDQLGKQYFFVKKYLTLCCIELIVLAGLRGYTIGADTATYLAAIDYYDDFSFQELIHAELVYPFDFEFGYFLLTKLSIILGLGKTGFLFLIAILVYIPVFLTIKNHSPMPYISIVCYFAFGFFTYSLGIFRQMLAISILLLGWNYVEERRLGRYLLLVFLATSMHSTAIIGILFYILYGMKWERFVPWLVPTEVVLFLFGRMIVLLVIRLLPKYAGFIGGTYDLQGGSYLMLFFLNLILFASILTKSGENDQNERMTITALICAVCLQCVGYSMTIVGRSVSYFSIYMMLAIPNIVCNIGDKRKHLWGFWVLIVLFAFVYSHFDGNKFVVPYYTVFQ